MNNERRDQLCDVGQVLEEAVGQIEEIISEEEDAFDALPEGLQMSSRGDAMQDAIDTMQGFCDRILEIKDAIEDYATPKKNRK